MRRVKLAVPILVLTLALPTVATAGEQVRDERRLFSDGTPQEVWTYDGAIAPDKLVLKELFWEDGKPRSRQEFVAGVQHGTARTWHSSGHQQSEEPWVDGGIHGLVQRWPDPWDDKERIKQRKPELEASYEGGVPHGAWQEWEGWGDDRWMKVERHYEHGELHGTDTVWRRADEMERKHSWAHGELHGRQLAWDSGGEMLYQFNFEDGLPHGPQRRYERDTIIVELFFDRGRLHGHQKFQDWQDGEQDWSNGLYSEVHTWDDGTPRTIVRSEWVPEEWLGNDGLLRFWGDRREVDAQRFDEQGRRTRYETKQQPRFTIEFFENGRVRRLGKERQNRTVIELYDDGGLARSEQWADHLREGETRVWDRRGRLVSRQTWDYNLKEHVVTTWHTDQQKAAEGGVYSGHDREAGHKTGTWTYWRPDGSLLRTETYDYGPYSGNRHFIVQMTEYDEQGRIRFEGGERELFLYDYDDEEPERVERRRTVVLLDRSRHGLESWDAKLLDVVRAEVKNPAELAEGAPTVELLGGRGRVSVDERFRDDGSPKAVERFDKKGLRDEVQEGWYRDGTPAYAFTYHRGDLLEAKEWWKDGSPRLHATFGGTNDALYLSYLVLRSEEGREWTWERREGRPFRAPDGFLDACLLYRFAPDAPRPQ